ncbi:hypothetical protein G6F57_006292 [Rhizopus arrhizus]|uniref:Uncharacterized protein n=1 Tax=Rhizopus oryzae TaxID=64495 RepID=A0A9P6XG90_RHIOR|nr:hypothetical protein G6F23_001353 [Rhizopus arrhizus]KAG1418426.1 hypothetical protein G6F58_005084 [Rhizopus delemar]KAG0766936.1 hypothetical protein G6F24_003209 [Rhizopus arrhizus]KAG0793649.1 hypothetical protein G6F21_003456 [Rhizopus arrhizus]KAG0800495.1 hypothetical protein G6F22_002176 [Rhizopus arrhizus]
MKFHFATLLLLAITFVSTVFATSSAASGLVARHVKYPVKANDALIVKIMASIEAQLNAKVLAQISASFSEEISGHLDVDAKVLGGLVSADVSVSAVEKLAIKKLKAELEAELKAKAKVDVYASVEAYLRKKCGSKRLTEKKLLQIIADVEAKAIETLKVELPKIGADLKLNSKAQVDIILKKVSVNIPLIASINVKGAFDIKAAISACVKVGVKVCAKLSATESAKVILKAL